MRLFQSDLSRKHVPPVNPVSTTMIGVSSATDELSAGVKSKPLDVYPVNCISRIDGSNIQSTAVEKTKISPRNKPYEERVVLSSESHTLSIEPDRSC